MSIFKTFKSRKLTKILCAAVAGGMLFIGSGDALAADSSAAANFRSSYIDTPTDNRPFRQTITFFGGTVFKADITSTGQILNDSSLRMYGNIDWSYTNPNTKQTDNLQIPFYVAQTGKNDMTIYVQRGTSWGKMTLPNVFVALAETLKTNDPSTLQANVKGVESVEMFRDTATQQIMKVTIDGKYIADIIQKNESSDANTTFVRNLKKSLQTENVVCTWTVDKETHQTITAVFELTDLIRSCAKNVLEDSAAGKVVLADEERNLLDAIGYYSVFHYSVSYYKPGETVNLSMPAGAVDAPTNNKMFSDLLGDMTQVVQR